MVGRAVPTAIVLLACSDVAPTASGHGDDHAHRSRRIALRSRDVRYGRQRSRAAEQRDKLATLHLRGHSITSSARASNVGGPARPRAFAVFRLITSSYLVGACTGRSAGLAPFRMRST